MLAGMAHRYRVSLLGFSGLERNALVSHFRMASKREPSYEHEQLLGDADFVVADADHEPSVALVQATERMADTVFVGLAAPPGAPLHLPRPVDALAVLRALDRLAAARRGAAAAPLPPAPGGSGVRTVIQTPSRKGAHDGERGDEAAPAVPAAPRAAPGRTPPVAPPVELFELTLPALSPPPPPPPPPTPPPSPPSPTRAPARTRAAGTRRAAPPPPTSALIVDDSEVAQRFLEIRLQRFGVDVGRAATSDEALHALGRVGYDLVFLDLELGEASELDGLALAQKIKREYADRMPPTTVVMVSAHCTEMDRVRGMLAGCDAFLGKPLDDAELERLLRRHGLVPGETSGA
jgi:CheY-like chemotaxis protein